MHIPIFVLMDFWDILPLIVGAYFLFGRSGRKQENSDKPVAKPKTKRREITFEEIWRKLDEAGKQMAQPEERPIHERPVEKHAEQTDLSGKAKRKKIAKVAYPSGYSEFKGEIFDDPYSHTDRDALHHQTDRHIDSDANKLNAEDIDLKQMVILDAIYRRPYQ